MSDPNSSKLNEPNVMGIVKNAILILDLLAERKRNRHIERFYPDEGPLRRELYRPHIAFFKAGKVCRERAIIAANRIGKSEGVGGYEMACHLTGNYPAWWEGRVFDRPVNAWACGSTGQTVRDIVQYKLLGRPGQEGTGMIPGEFIAHETIRKKPGGVPDAVESVRIKHASGGYSYLTFKSFDQKRKAFEGTEQDVIWLDEEAPLDIYGECLIRTMTVDGIILLTFTPLMGLSDVVLNFMPEGLMPKKKKWMDADLMGGFKGKKFIVNATWDDAPHLTEEDKEDIWEGTPLHLRDARAKGIPQLGAGVIYPILEEDITIDDFAIPPFFPRFFALDIGWNATAASWYAWDREVDVLYLTSVYKQGQRSPADHVTAIHARGDWIPGVIDPAAIGRGQLDGKRMIDEYMNLGLNLGKADNAVEAGIFAVWQRLTSGRLKIFKSCVQWFGEYRIYRRDDNGKVMAKQEDHLMDTTRYAVLSGLYIAALPPYDEEEEFYYGERSRTRATKRSAGYFGIY